MTELSIDELEEIRARAVDALTAAVSLEELDAARNATLGRRGELTAVQRRLGELDEATRREVGARVNAIRSELSELESARRAELEAERDRVQLAAESVDVTLPPRTPSRGHPHPVVETMEAMLDVLVGLGFRVVTGPEVETDWHNFDALNTPQDHPARTLQDTLYLEALDPDAPLREDGTTGVLLRTQTSPVQVRTMSVTEPPVYVVAPGRVYRSDTADATHSPMFHQIEGLAVDEQLSFADLRGTLVAFCRALLGEETPVRMRPAYFPFTEPSCELDVFSGGRWLELLGAGMVHPNVLRNVGYDPEQVRGFAWGIGVDRMAMMRHGIADLRLLFSNDVRFLAAF